VSASITNEKYLYQLPWTVAQLRDLLDALECMGATHENSQEIAMHLLDQPQGLVN